MCGTERAGVVRSPDAAALDNTAASCSAVACVHARTGRSAGMAGEVTWEDEGDVREIIADVRDAECEMTWCVALAGVLCLPRAPCFLHTGDWCCSRSQLCQDAAVLDVLCPHGHSDGKARQAHMRHDALFWCRVIFGYGPLGVKKLTVLEAGDGGMAEMTQHLVPDAVMFCFMQVGCKRLQATRSVSNPVFWEYGICTLSAYVHMS